MGRRRGHLRLRDGVHATNEGVQEAGVELEEGVDHVRGGDGEEEAALMADEIQRWLHQPVNQLPQE